MYLDFLLLIVIKELIANTKKLEQQRGFPTASRKFSFSVAWLSVNGFYA